MGRSPRRVAGHVGQAQNLWVTSRAAANAANNFAMGGKRTKGASSPGIAKSPAVAIKAEPGLQQPTVPSLCSSQPASAGYPLAAAFANSAAPRNEKVLPIIDEVAEVAQVAMLAKQMAAAKAAQVAAPKPAHAVVHAPALAETYRVSTPALPAKRKADAAVTAKEEKDSLNKFGYKMSMAPQNSRTTSQRVSTYEKGNSRRRSTPW